MAVSPHYQALVDYLRTSQSTQSAVFTDPAALLEWMRDLPLASLVAVACSPAPVTDDPAHPRYMDLLSWPKLQNLPAAFSGERYFI